MSLFPKFKPGLGPVATPATSATQPPESSKSSESSRPLRGEVNYRTLYQQMAEAIADDCFLIAPAWLLDHLGFYERIRALDDRLTTIELIGGNVGEYRETLGQLMACIQDARAVCEREREQAGEKAAVQ